ncbi:MAG: hypothetical protein QOJ75_1851 [Chloroflexota bacterium]|nr:hypothetical protein [Chloroflexota bacterium]
MTVNPIPCRPAKPILAIVLVLVLVGCGASAGSLGASTGAPATPSGSSSVGPAASDEPVASVAPSTMPTVEPSASPAAEASRAQPPRASIAVDGGDPVEGQLGSYSWFGQGSDAPWLDGRPIHIGAGERLTLTLADPVAVVNWTASRVQPGNRDGFGAVGMGQGSGSPVAFDAPPPGSWSVGVTVWFGGNRGSAAYYWLVEVR